MVADLLGVPEVAELLGVSRQRADVLTREPDFPEPAETERRGKRERRYWRKGDVERYGRATGRTPEP